MKISPSQAKYKDILRMGRDNKNFGDFGILVDADINKVYLSEHKSGEIRKQEIEIPRNYFNKIVKWYLKPQKLRF